MTADILKPRDAADVVEILRAAASQEEPLEIVGHGGKRGYGRPVQASRTLDLSRLSGITLYEPEELVLRAGAGTPLSTIAAALSATRSRCAEPSSALRGTVARE